jgi:hypothetical protein
MNKKYAVGVWNDKTKKYEVHHRTDIHEYAKAQAAIINQNGAVAIVLIFNEE